jgi:hypothetical protein
MHKHLPPTALALALNITAAAAQTAPTCETYLLAPLRNATRETLQVLQSLCDSTPTDPEVLEEQQKKLQEDLQKRADELRKKLRGQDGTGPSAPLR